jgi:hypothetical protein
LIEQRGRDAQHASIKQPGPNLFSYRVSALDLIPQHADALAVAFLHCHTNCLKQLGVGMIDEVDPAAPEPRKLSIL